MEAQSSVVDTTAAGDSFNPPTLRALWMTTIGPEPFGRLKPSQPELWAPGAPERSNDLTDGLSDRCPALGQVGDASLPADPSRRGQAIRVEAVV